MRLICPNCVAQYEVDEDVIPSEGRDVQCANCGHNWFQDALQMLSSEADIPTGSGDPESDVPPELFNDLEGKLDTSFTSVRANVAPDPNDMEPENPRDDFQIEQKPEAPSSRMDKDALDVLHAEAEYSSGQKPPAASEQKSESPETSPDVQPQEAADEPPDSPVAEPVAEVKQPQETTHDTQEPTKPVDEDDLDDIRRRIMSLEAQESGTGQPTPAPEPKPATEPVPDKIDDIVIPNLDAQETPTPQQKPAPRADNPFSRPSVSATRASSATHPPRANPVEPAEPQYAENIPVEEAIAAALHRENSGEDLVAEQAETEVITNKPMGQATPHPFPDLDAPDLDADDTLYAAIDAATETRSDMFPDVDELSSEIASEANHNTLEHQPTETKIKSKSGFFKGFRYAIYLCVVIAALYQFQPVIIEYIPQAEGVLTKLTDLVDMAASQIGPLINPLIEKIKGLIG